MTWGQPADLLVAAREVATRRAGWGSAWPRAAAVLTRQALEGAIQAAWTDAEAGMRGEPLAHQLSCLPWCQRSVDRDLARRARHTWHALSRACHAHLYELCPTAAELLGWIEEVEAVVGALGT